ncbi:L,D-transpeptidase family protein [Streptomyces niveus]|uniref:L,D-transpeptidase family protein n=1 Tax=Streptomyces niveus TaxID=193462 RepID=UPI0035D91FCD
MRHSSAGPASVRPASVSRPYVRLAIAPVVLLSLAASLTACSSAASGETADGKRPADGGASRAAASPATVTVTPSGKDAEAGRPVKVTAHGGTLTSVTVTDDRGRTLKGSLKPKGTVWVSDRKAVPGASYTVTAATRTEDGGTGRAEAAFSTARAGKVNKTDWRPGAGVTVGVAQPVSLVFDNPVANKAEVERQLKVTTSNDTQGSWGWVRDWSGRDRVDWRPKTYWEPGTKVTLRAELNGTDSGTGGGWFVRDYSTTFTVGARQVVEVDLDKHRLTLVRDGETVREIPVSGGTPGGDKRSWRGTAVLMAKEGTINMNSETVGLGDAYDKMVDHSMRLTWSGMYAHAAPWNAKYLGVANRSSGCIGMGDADAAWFYRQVRVGDPFEIKGADTKGTVEPGNGFGAWNLSWPKWRERSALD